MGEDTVPGTWLTLQRSKRGFALFIVTILSAVMLLIVSTAFLHNGADRRDGIAERGTSDSLYAAEAGIHALAGKLSELGFGKETIASTSLPFVTTTGPLDKDTVTADLASGSIQLGASYHGGVPQAIGNGFGYLVYRVDRFDADGNSLGAGALDSTVGKIEAQVLGFRGRNAAFLKVAIKANLQTVLYTRRYAGFGWQSVALGGGDTSSAMPFCRVDSLGQIDCTQVNYVRGVYRNKINGQVGFVDSSSNSSLATALAPLCSSLSDCERVTAIYRDSAGVPYYATDSRPPASNLTEWPVVESTTGQLKALPPLTLIGTSVATTFAPDLPQKTILNRNGAYGLDPDYHYLPKGNQGNLGSHNSVGANGSNATIDGAVEISCQNCLHLNGATSTGGTRTIGYFDLPPAPSTPSISRTQTIADTNGGSTTIEPAVVDSTLSGADKYEVVQLTGENSSQVRLSDQQVLTLKSGRYVVNDLDLSERARLELQPVGGDPIVLYVVNGANTARVDITASTANGSGTANLQIYSNDEATIHLTSGAALRAIVYAPNASLSVQAEECNSRTGCSYLAGTFLGKQVTLNGNRTRLLYDESLPYRNFPLESTANVILRDWQHL